MALPTAPSLTTICTDALRLAGYPTPTAAQLTQAELWIEETKQDIWLKHRRLKPLLMTAYGVTAVGKSRYALPSAFDIMSSCSILDGDSGTAQAAADSTLTLAAATTATEASLQGKLLLITSGTTGTGSCSQITAFNTTTKVATVTPNWTTTPTGTITYLIVDEHTLLTKKPLNERDEITEPYELDKPSEYSIHGQANADENETGEIQLYYTPDEIYGIEMKYYINLELMDLSTDSNLVATLYRRWRSIFKMGVKVRALDKDRDERYQPEWDRYHAMIESLTINDMDYYTPNRTEEGVYY